MRLPPDWRELFLSKSLDLKLSYVVVPGGIGIELSLTLQLNSVFCGLDYLNILSRISFCTDFLCFDE